MKDTVELPTSNHNVEPNVHEQKEEEDDGNDLEDEDKSDIEDDGKESTENRGACSETSEWEIAHESGAQENVTRICCEKVISSKTDFNDHMAADHTTTSYIAKPVI